MAEKASRRVKTLNSFIKWAAQFNDGQYLFRGVSNERYEIEASAYRRLPEGAINNPDMLLRNQSGIDRKSTSSGARSERRAATSLIWNCLLNFNTSVQPPV